MEEKDEFDLFIEKAEEVVRLFENGQDVRNEAEKLLKDALSVDAECVPSTCVKPDKICKILNYHINKTSSPPVQSIRMRHFTRSPTENKKIINTIKVQPNSSSCLRCTVLIIIFTLLCLIAYHFYFLRLPTRCPRPTW
ncbi:Dynein light chain [Caenorhabditis elegans]|uniref:Dynein light chain n=1 Tax=Caenorhabditis elegans TaxID=6239 RepID=Q9XWR9_CAEEL|nr:Dynein light chain [Caenorhabditis elegans]CAA21579.1 Dynein light chain [Caenorhabditis elegans]|eukprot:NP_492740.1 Uncharacterized protein CELE_Y106G6H.16 [Caenorhabditis elegans]